MGIFKNPKARGWDERLWTGRVLDIYKNPWEKGRKRMITFGKSCGVQVETMMSGRFLLDVLKKK